MQPVNTPKETSKIFPEFRRQDANGNRAQHAMVPEDGPLVFIDSIHQSPTAIQFNQPKYNAMYDRKACLLPQTLLPEATHQPPGNVLSFSLYISDDLLTFPQDLNTSPPPRKPQHNVELNMCLKQERSTVLLRNIHTHACVQAYRQVDRQTDRHLPAPCTVHHCFSQGF